MAKKISKVILCCVSIVLCLSLCFIPIISSAAAPPITNELMATTYCPTFYATYRPVGDYFAGHCSVGGQVTLYQTTVGSRNGALMCSRYFNPDSTYSLFRDDVKFTSYGISDSGSPYHNTASIIYGVSSGLIETDTTFFYMPFYSIADFGLSLYISDSYKASPNTVQHVSASSLQASDTSDYVYIRVVYKRGDGSQGVYEINQLSRDTPFYVQNPSSEDFSSMRHYMKQHDSSFTDDSKFFSLEVIYTYTPSSDHYESSIDYYVNCAVAIGDANSYITNRDYYNGVKSFGYELGVSDTSEFNETGVFGLISSSVAGFLMFDIWNGFTLGHMLMICISVPLFVWIIKLLAGG